MLINTNNRYEYINVDVKTPQQTSNVQKDEFLQTM